MGPGDGRDTREVKGGGEKVGRLTESGNRLAGGEALGMPEEEGDLAEFFVDDGGTGDALFGWVAFRRFAQEAVLAEVVAVIGAKKDGGGVENFFFAEECEESADVVVDLRNLSSIESSHVLDLSFGVAISRSGMRPENFVGAVQRIRLLKDFRSVPRFVRVECVDPKKKLFGRGV